MKRHTVALTYAFNPREDLFESMLAPRDGQLYKSIIQKVYSSPRAFERIASWRDLYKHT